MFPSQQHFAVLSNLVLLFLGAQQILGVDILEPDEHSLDSGASGLLNEVWKPVTQSIDLDNEAHPDLLDLAQVDKPIKNRFPVFVAGKVIVGNEERVETLGYIRPDYAFDIVC
jgi:hypothetical protein